MNECGVGAMFIVIVLRETEPPSSLTEMPMVCERSLM
jgi:hypothetical protein